MRRWTFLLYGVTCHLLFFVIYAALAAFVGNLFLPNSIDANPATGPSAVMAAGSVDLGLIALFAVQHSVMARPWFKRHWTRIVPKPIERSTYVLISCVLTALWIWKWRAIGPVIWDVRQPAARAVLWSLFAAGWLMVPAVSLMINHFDLFGTRQVWLHLHRRENQVDTFRTPSLYRHMRHPLYVGWTIAFWATPTMTFGHLLFAATLTLYMAIATLFEERDLVGVFGDEYRAYQARVPRFIPRLASDRQSTAHEPSAVKQPA